MVFAQMLGLETISEDGVQGKSIFTKGDYEDE